MNNWKEIKKSWEDGPIDMDKVEELNLGMFLDEDQEPDRLERGKRYVRSCIDTDRRITLIEAIAEQMLEEYGLPPRTKKDK